MGEWSRTINGSTGGTIRVTEPTSAAFGTALTIPAGAFVGSLTFTIRETPDVSLPKSASRVGLTVSIEPLGFLANVGVVLEIPFSRHLYNQLTTNRRKITLFRHDQGQIHIPEGPIALPNVGETTPVKVGRTTIIANPGALSASDRLWQIPLSVETDGKVKLGTFTVGGTE